jgi:hypothetical protein
VIQSFLDTVGHFLDFVMRYIDLAILLLWLDPFATTTYHFSYFISHSRDFISYFVILSCVLQWLNHFYNFVSHSWGAIFWDFVKHSCDFISIFNIVICTIVTKLFLLFHQVFLRFCHSFFIILLYIFENRFLSFLFPLGYVERDDASYLQED